MTQRKELDPLIVRSQGRVGAVLAFDGVALIIQLAIPKSEVIANPITTVWVRKNILIK
jgi:hypothetical protein